ncbi:MAG: hypothetical protein OCC46_05350 [Pseudodesulfovibrio sp.]
MTKQFIDKEYEIEDADTTRSFGKGETREDYADAWKGTGNVVLVGLPGSGKVELAQLLAERTKLPVVTPATADEAINILGGKSTIIILDDTIVEVPTVQSLIHGSGKVFYLMADSKTLAARIAERDSVDDEETLWREMSARLAVMEPIFYGALHFLLQATTPTEELVEDALEKVAF